ncbi:OLC1v1019495C3 [Oldenlandia corymbosa var. corymbosa]|uniref:OLC1v1019495C3 n=1 Tax=Oldenlandia corymbosa var. corymbosa TaxID=529605 RepID=A0AAV1EE23_OLDCO|nr:OLC1v1019495C3 [Oldenlandia corymbosa var. corymbosa]
MSADWLTQMDDLIVSLCLWCINRMSFNSFGLPELNDITVSYKFDCSFFRSKVLCSLHNYWSLTCSVKFSDLMFRRGLITRNVKDAVDLFHLRFGITFAPALSREFRPYKPDPAPLLHICSTWNIQPNEVMMIGDSLKDDVACGKRAGAFTCLLDQTGRYNSPEYKHVEFQPDYKITSLDEVVKLLEDDFDLAP